LIEECRIAGLDTSAIAVMLGKRSEELADSIRPEVWEQLEQLIARIDLTSHPTAKPA